MKQYILATALFGLLVASIFSNIWIVLVFLVIFVGLPWLAIVYFDFTASKGGL